MYVISTKGEFRGWSSVPASRIKVLRTVRLFDQGQLVILPGLHFIPTSVQMVISSILWMTVKVSQQRWNLCHHLGWCLGTKACHLRSILFTSVILSFFLRISTWNSESSISAFVRIALMFFLTNVMFLLANCHYKNTGILWPWRVLLVAGLFPECDRRWCLL